MLPLPIFDIPCDVHTDESDYQVVGVILQYQKHFNLVPMKLLDTPKYTPLYISNYLVSWKLLRSFR